MRAALGAVALALAVALPAAAADWGDIVPGTTTQAQVRARHGAPTRTATQKVDNVDTAQWVYEGAQAPVGTRRMTVDFGLTVGGTLRADVVRDFRLELKPGAFNQVAIVNGWGVPSRRSPPGQPLTFIYASGLIVTFDKDGWLAETMLFTPPQPLPAAPPAR